MDTKALRQKVLDLAIRGKLVPQDPNDEPASVLLERIRQEKQQMVKEGKLKPKDIKNDSIIFKGDDNLHYEKFADGTVKEYELDLDTLPTGWLWCNLGFLFNHNTGKALNSSKNDGELLTYITTSNVYWNKFILDKLKMMPFTEEELTKCTVKKGDLLVCEGGDIGRSAIWEYDEEIRIQNHLHRLRAYNRINVKFYYYVLYLYKLVGKINGQGIGLQGLSSNALHSLVVPLPPVEEQMRIVNKLELILDNVDLINDKNEELEESIECVKSKILDLAIRGKLVTQYSDDEPASALLERIRVEKEELIKQGKIKRDKNKSIIFKSDDNSYYEKFADGTIKCIDDEITFDIPDSWIWSRGCMCMLGMTTTTPTGNSFQYIDIDAIDNKNHIIKRPKVIETSNAPSRAKRALKKGDVLFSLVRPYLENIALITEELSDCIASTGFYVCRPANDLNSDYLFLLMTSSYVINGLNQFMKGDNSPSINKEHIENWLFPIPPIEEQTRIVETINLFYNYLSKAKKSLE